MRILQAAFLNGKGVRLPRPHFVRPGNDRKSTRSPDAGDSHINITVIARNGVDGVDDACDEAIPRDQWDPRVP